MRTKNNPKTSRRPSTFMPKEISPLTTMAGLAAAARQYARTDHVLNFLKREGHAPTVDTYCELNYSMSWADVQRGEYPEWEAEVLDLIESGDLKLETAGTRSIQ
jgi:hypothetical protein